MTTTSVDCSHCTARPRACGDCVISVLLGPPEERDVPLSLDGSERAALATLADSGLVPHLRLVTPLPAGRKGGSPVPDHVEDCG